MVDTPNWILDLSKQRKSWLCVGLDPVPADVPQGVSVEAFLKGIIQATGPHAVAFKANLAFFLALGRNALDTLVHAVREANVHAPVILDAKFGDVGSTAEQQARFAFDLIGADAVTVNPYLGKDAVLPFAKHQGRMVFLLGRTSNPGAAEIQEAQLAGGDAVYEHVVRRALKWGVPDLGFVAGATDLPGLTRVRRVAGEAAWLLVPGVGAQGGDAGDAVRGGGNMRKERAIVNVSRHILYASRRADDFAERAGAAAERFARSTYDV